MTNMSNSVAPQGAGGKDTSHFNPDANRALSDGEMGDFTDHLSGVRNQSRNNPSLTREQIIEENLLRASHNEKCASRRADPNHIEGSQRTRILFCSITYLPFLLTCPRVQRLLLLIRAAPLLMHFLLLMHSPLPLKPSFIHY